MLRRKVTPCYISRQSHGSELLSLSLPTHKVTSCDSCVGQKIIIYPDPETIGIRMSAGQNLQTEQRPESPSNAVEVILKHSGIENRIIGTPEAVLRELLTYFSKVYPAIDLVSKVLLSPDNTEFLQSCAGVLAVSPEGPVILRNVSDLKDKELMILHLAGSRLMFVMGKKDVDSLSLDELTRVTGRATGTVAGRLSELTNEQLVDRVGKGSYKLTTMGTRVAIRNVLSKAIQLPER